ncbi:MAG: hypothetical protein JSS64_08665 [Bacteroidetes bacterium]|nr:hypothetical protein [Bacteroidota bacterium]
MKATTILTILFLTIALVSCGQTTKSKNSKTEFKALAKLVSSGEGSKIYIAKYKIIKDFSDTIFADTINVGYYFYKDNQEQLDTVLLTLTKYDGQTELKNYFICPNYDATIGIQKAKVDFIGFDYWENCETGKGECKPLNFIRTKKEKNWFLIMPCGGTETKVMVSSADKTFSQEQHLFHDKCPPFLALTDLKDGKYFAQMMACGLGGQVEFNLTTSK